MLICDAHCHFFSQRFFETLARQAGETGKDPVAGVLHRLGWEAPGTPAQLADRWIAEMNQHHVARAALIASVPGDEESVADAVERHPDRLVGFFMLDPTAADAPERLARAAERGSLRCVCLFPAMHGYRLDGEEVRRVFSWASDRRAAVFVHCGVLSIGIRKKLGLPSRFDIRLGHPLDLVPVAQRHPDVPIVIPHFGAGFFRDALMAASICPNIYFDTSSSNSWMRFQPGLTLAAVFHNAAEVVGPDRLLFGTDSSYFPRGWQVGLYEHQFDLLGDANVDPQVVQKLLHGNFDRLFPAPGAR